MKQPVLVFVTVVTIGLFFVYIHASRQPVDTNALSTEATEQSIQKKIVLETQHQALLVPHQHDDGDSILNEGHHVDLLSEPYVFDEDVWVTGIEFEVHNAPEEVIHHINLFKLNERDPLCPQEPRLLAAFAEDNVDVSPFFLPSPYGMRFSKNDRLALFAMLHNPLPPLGSGRAYEDVYVTITLHVEPVHTSERTNIVDFYLMHVEETPCTGGNLVFSVPPHTIDFSFRPNPMIHPQPGILTFPTDGEIIYIGSHLHGWEGGKELNLYMNDVPIRSYKSRFMAERNGTWHTDQGFDSIQVSFGDTLLLEALYENASESTTTGAMGMLGFFFAPAQYPSF